MCSMKLTCYNFHFIFAVHPKSSKTENSPANGKVNDTGGSSGSMGPSMESKSDNFGTVPPDFYNPDCKCLMFLETRKTY